MDIAVNILLTIATAATPLLIAAIGELVVERSGVLNLGVEGMMIMGAVGGFGAGYVTGSPWIGLLAAIAMGALFSLLFAVMTLSLATNQVATGLSLTLLGLGLSGMIGTSFVGQPGVRLPNLDIPVLTEIPVIGKLLFGQDRTHLAQTDRGQSCGREGAAAGDAALDRRWRDPAHALGIKVIRYRYLSVIFGGACAGLAGGHLSLVYTPQWVENMSAGRGWIALALVVFASWRPWRVLAGAYIFGAVWIGQLHAQAFGIPVPSQMLSSLPYLATVVVLVLISRNKRLTMMNTPASLGQPFVPDR